MSQEPRRSARKPTPSTKFSGMVQAPIDVMLQRRKDDGQKQRDIELELQEEQNRWRMHPMRHKVLEEENFAAGMRRMEAERAERDQQMQQVYTPEPYRQKRLQRTAQENRKRLVQGWNEPPGSVMHGKRYSDAARNQAYIDMQLQRDMERNRSTSPSSRFDGGLYGNPYGNMYRTRMPVSGRF